jgi:hypothetical protein
MDGMLDRSDAFAREVLEILFRHDPIGTAYDPEFDQTEYLPETRAILALVDQARDESEMQTVVRQAFELQGVLDYASSPKLTAAAGEIWSAWRRAIDRRLPPGPASPSTDS